MQIEVSFLDKDGREVSILVRAPDITEPIDWGDAVMEGMNL